MPVVRLLLEAVRPLALKEFEREISGDPVAEEKIVAVLDRRQFPLPVDQGDFDALPGQSMRLEKWPQIGPPRLTSMMHDNPFRLNLDQIQSASPGHESDYPLCIGSVERHQPLPGPLHNRLL